jgi:hypothetical protein
MTMNESNFYIKLRTEFGILPPIERTRRPKQGRTHYRSVPPIIGQPIDLIVFNEVIL